jgi:hypothetical protein
MHDRFPKAGIYRSESCFEATELPHLQEFERAKSFQNSFTASIRYNRRERLAERNTGSRPPRTLGFRHLVTNWQQESRKAHTGAFS